MNDGRSKTRPPGIVASCEGIVCVERAPGESQVAFHRDVATGRTIMLLVLIAIAALGFVCWQMIATGPR
jgi:hypothetical protein